MRAAEPGRDLALDGVRGLAIALVLFHHCVVYSDFDRGTRLDNHVLATGLSAWIGVDLFFVLSGFLITRILLDARDTEHYFRNFYARRTLRIFPLYYACLAVAFIVLPILWPRSADLGIADGQAWYWLYLSNVDVTLNGWSDPPYLGHFWSLAVEEQFYLVWPMVVLACGGRRLAWVSGACMLIALALRFVLPQWLGPLASYVLMPARMDAFAAGAIVAIIAASPGGLRRLGRWPLLALIAAAATLAILYRNKQGLDAIDPTIRTFGYSVIAIGFAALIAVVAGAREESRWRRCFSNPVLATLGKYSYALYVFHHPIVIQLESWGLNVDSLPRLFGSQVPGLAAFGAVAVGTSLACALLSWRLIETPFLRMKRYFRSRASTQPTASAAYRRVTEAAE